ncbi:hypothetical protein [Anoxybacteroides tepidamans]|uniref:hypothetical protein n=1 Tax=Anoxybacteroides tepidamans TaxID=265948 RepID=UPI000487B545|nr:hypothetical protein [Anoxybacillus tepidamans]
MKKMILLVLLLVHLAFIAYYLTYIAFPFNMLSLISPIFFIFSIILSIAFLLRYRTEANTVLFLSIAVLLSSLSSLGVWGFHYYLARVMGG